MLAREVEKLNKTGARTTASVLYCCSALMALCGVAGALNRTAN